MWETFIGKNIELNYNNRLHNELISLMLQLLIGQYMGKWFKQMKPNAHIAYMHGLLQYLVLLILRTGMVVKVLILFFVFIEI